MEALDREVFERDGWRCRVPWCKRRQQLERHHVVPRSQGGPDTKENSVILCHGCHRDRHDGKLRIGLAGVRVEFKRLRW